MQQKDLMKTRYKVIADYPGSPFDVGSIIQKGNGHAWLIGDQSWGGGTVPQFNRYPHLFHPLQWWEERKPEEMPYAAKMDNGWVCLMSQFKKGEDQDFPDALYWGSWHISCFKPATREEYQAYLSTKP